MESEKLTTKCIGIRQDQVKYYEKLDINFSKRVRRLLDDDITHQSGAKQSDESLDLFEYVKDLLMENNNEENPQLTLNYVKTVMRMVIPCFYDHTALLNDNDDAKLKIDLSDTILRRFNVDMKEFSELADQGKVEVEFFDRR